MFLYTDLVVEFPFVAGNFTFVRAYIEEDADLRDKMFDPIGKRRCEISRGRVVRGYLFHDLSIQFYVFLTNTFLALALGSL